MAVLLKLLALKQMLHRLFTWVNDALSDLRSGIHVTHDYLLPHRSDFKRENIHRRSCRFLNCLT